jgi:carbon starvation protein
MFSRLTSFFPWLALSCLGFFSIVHLALHRGESINSLWIMLAGICCFAISYRFYSKWLLTQVFVADPSRQTPACRLADGKDYVPTHHWVVFGHHFAAIAGPGPLVGPILAAQFGYLPGTLWILIGATLGGGVQDAMMLFCSMRNDGKTLGQLIKEEISKPIGLIAMVAILIITCILIAVLGLVVVNALADSPWGLFTILMTIPLALIMGVFHHKLGFSVSAVSTFGVIGLLFSVWAGGQLEHWGLDTFFTLNKTALAWSIMFYGIAASALPVWILLAPRDYLSTFMKIGTIGLLIIALLIVAPSLQMPAMTSFIHGNGLVFPGTVLPFVCITIACGAISGFHALVASGTTSKMVENEKSIRSIAYGAMITEMLVALTALILACSMQPAEYFAINAAANKNKSPAEIHQLIASHGFSTSAMNLEQTAKDIGEKTLYGRAGGAPTFALGMARLFDQAFGKGWLSLWYHFAIMFEALFILTTIDAGTRVGRFMLQEILGILHPKLGDTSSTFSNALSSLLFVSSWGYFLYTGVVDPYGGINTLWPLFGIANQLLAVIAFTLGVTVLIRTGKTRYWWTCGIPLLFLCLITFSAGLIKLFSKDPALGFLSAAASFKAKIQHGGSPQEILVWSSSLLNNRIDAFVTLFFLISVVAILAGASQRWIFLHKNTAKID